MSRLLNFFNLEFHPMLGKDFSKLKEADIQFCVQYLKSCSESGWTDDEYMHDVNRLEINGHLKDYKNKNLIWALLSQSIEVKVRRRE